MNTKKQCPHPTPWCPSKNHGLTSYEKTCHMSSVRPRNSVSIARKKYHRVITAAHCTKWASYQIRKIAGCACAGNVGNVSPAADFNGNRWLAIPVCITARASRTCRDACRDRLPAVAGKTFPAFPAHAQPAILRIWQEAHGCDTVPTSGDLYVMLIDRSSGLVGWGVQIYELLWRIGFGSHYFHFGA